MLSSKQRSYLRSMSNKLEPVMQIGKGGTTPELTESVNEVLEKRELIKLSVLNNCMESPKDVAETLSGRTRSDIVSVIGGKIVLFRVSKKKPVIELPKDKNK